MFNKLIIFMALAFALTGCSDSGLFSSSNDNNTDLFDFSMVPSGYQKAASDEDLDNVGAVATLLKTLDQKVLRAGMMGEVDDLTRLQTGPSAYSSLDQEINQELSLCSIDTSTDRVGNITLIAYGFMPDTRCPFSLSGNYKQSSGAVHPPSIDSPTFEMTQDSFTLTALPDYTGEIARITLSLNSRSLRQVQNERGKASLQEKQTTVTGVVTLASGAEIKFGLKYAEGQSSTKVTDRRTNNSLTTDFRGGFELAGVTTLYQKLYQKTPADKKATNMILINGIQQK